MDGVMPDAAPAMPEARSRGRRLIVIFNPTAGQRKVRRLARALKLFPRDRPDLVIERTTARGDAEALARSAPSEATVIVAGGDGTANEAANGRLAAGGGRLAVIPLGTANVLAAELGIDSLASAAAAAQDGTPVICRPGLANGRGFVMMAGVGVGGHVV